MFRDGLLRTIIFPIDRPVFVELLELPEYVLGGEIVRLGVLLPGCGLVVDRLLILRLEIFGLEVIELERLGEVFRVEILGALLRLGALDMLGRLIVLRFAPIIGLEERDGDLGAGALRLLLLELLLFRELLAAHTGSTESVKIKMEKAKMKEVIPVRRDSTILIFDI